MMVSLGIVAMTACTPSEQEVLQGILQNVDSAQGEMSLVTKDGRTVHLDFKMEDSNGSLEVLEAGSEIEVEVSRKGVVEVVRSAEVKGTVTVVKGNEVTLTTASGRTVTVLATEATRIELEDDDIPATLVDLQVGDEVEVHLNLESRAALKIELRDDEDRENGRRGRGPGRDDREDDDDAEMRGRDRAEVKGVISHINNGEVTVETSGGKTVVVLATGSTVVELEDDDVTATVNDLRVGDRVEVKFDPTALTAFELEVEDAEDEAKVRGVITKVEGSKVTVETAIGRAVTLQVTGDTRIQHEDGIMPITPAALRVGVQVEVEFDPRSMNAFEVEVDDEDEIKGVISGVEGQVILVEAEGGRAAIIQVATSTVVELRDDDMPGTVADLRIGDRVEVKISPDGSVVEIEVRDERQDEDNSGRDGMRDDSGSNRGRDDEDDDDRSGRNRGSS
ncbi:MAG: hypothetical protein HY681_14915 [Chloroflexi bacterium]|nr:hypothetical protein [Chloroflexota bacterium]